MAQITREQFDKIFTGSTLGNRDKAWKPLCDTMDKYTIDTPLRIAAFLAQLGHESGGLQYLRELATGMAYEGRKDLGNTSTGDGARFKGRGYIQITGKNNYTLLSTALGVDFITNPQFLEKPQYAALSAGWFWDVKKLNHYADLQDFVSITKLINGGTNGMLDRQRYYNLAKEVLLPPTAPHTICEVNPQD